MKSAPKADFHGVLYPTRLPSTSSARATFINAANFLTANGKAGYKGVEFFASGEVVKNLSLIASGTVLDAKQLNARHPHDLPADPRGPPRKYAGSLFGEWRVPQVQGPLGPRPVVSTSVAGP